jgi:uncharacterized membrane protein YkvA (DUF1232 family)
MVDFLTFVRTPARVITIPSESYYLRVQRVILKDRPYQKEEEDTHMRDNGFVTFILIMALIYILSPIDLIPDVIPVVGWVDDVAVAVGAGAVALGAGRR